MRYVETTSVNIDALQPYPGNPRTHDDAALDESAEVNGQYRSVVVRRINGQGLQLLAGHGTVAAFARRGDTDVRVEVIDADDSEARRIVLADNGTSRNAAYDEQLLVDLLERTADDGGLLGSGFDADTYQELVNRLNLADSFLPDDEDVPRLDRLTPIMCPNCGHEFLPK